MVYLVATALHNARDALALYIITAIFVAGIIYGKIQELYGDIINKNCIDPLENFVNVHWSSIKW